MHKKSGNEENAADQDIGHMEICWMTLTILCQIYIFQNQRDKLDRKCLSIEKKGKKRKKISKLDIEINGHKPLCTSSNIKIVSNKLSLFK